MSSTTLSAANNTIVSAFQRELLRDLLVVLFLLLLVVIAAHFLRSVELRRAEADREGVASPYSYAEPLPRRVLRLGFGVIWVFDGILQAQSAMPVGLATQVIQPTASGSPHWVHVLVNAGVLIWNRHPVTAAVAAVWIQVGIGLWLIVAPRGWWSRAGGVASVGWGLVVWVFGESLGQMLAPGQSLLFGLPGAALLYCLAGALVAAPERIWAQARTGRILCGLFGSFLLGMALLQAWPGNGFWQGRIANGGAGPIDAMVTSMASTPQPGWIQRLVTSFGKLDAAHGFFVNLVVVAVLGLVGLALLSRRAKWCRVAVFVSCAFFLLVWVLIEDFGFFGGLGTDPNNMIPLSLLVVGSYLALVRPEQAAAFALPRASVREQLQQRPVYAFRCLLAGCAAVVTMLGTVPMAAASTNAHADAIITEASNGAPEQSDAPAPNFRLSNQYGKAVSLRSLRGRTVVLTFLDPVCTSDCPVIGGEMRNADELLGPHARVTFVAIVANPLYRAPFYLRAYDAEEHMSHLSNWLYLTGSPHELQQVWDDYGVSVAVYPAGAMVDHSEIAFVIDARGKIRYIDNADPGPASSVSTSSFVTLIDEQVQSVAR